MPTVPRKTELEWVGELDAAPLIDAALAAAKAVYAQAGPRPRHSGANRWAGVAGVTAAASAFEALTPVARVHLPLLFACTESGVNNAERRAEPTFVTARAAAVAALEAALRAAGGVAHFRLPRSRQKAGGVRRARSVTARTEDQAAAARARRNAALKRKRARMAQLRAVLRSRCWAFGAPDRAQSFAARFVAAGWTPREAADLFGLGER